MVSRAESLVELASLPGVSVASGMNSGRHGEESGDVLPVNPLLRDLFPSSGLLRGNTISVQGSRSLLLMLLAEVTTSGAWAAVVGMPDLGIVAASELGVELSRMALIPQPGAHLASVIAALCEGMDLVVVDFSLLAKASGIKSATTLAHRLSARVRHRNMVLLCWGQWPGAQMELQCRQSPWQGTNSGKGYFTSRQVTIRSRGRASASRPRQVTFSLPGSEEVFAGNVFPLQAV